MGEELRWGISAVVAFFSVGLSYFLWNLVVAYIAIKRGKTWGQQIIRLLTKYKNAKCIKLTPIMGSTKSSEFASQIKDFLKKKEYSVNIRGQAIRTPFKGIYYNEPNNEGVIKIIVGEP